MYSNTAVIVFAVAIVAPDNGTKWEYTWVHHELYGIVFVVAFGL